MASTHDNSTNINSNSLIHPISQSTAPVSPSPVYSNYPYSSFISSTPVQSPIQNVISQTVNPSKVSKKQRHIKGEYKRKLKEENYQLKKQIKELELQISTKEAENAALQNQVSFFQQYMSMGTDIAENSPNQGDSSDNNAADGCDK